MALGLTENELAKLIKDEYWKEKEAMIIEPESLRSEYIMKGIPANYAEAMAKLSVELLASQRSLVSVITKNNLEIEKQLKSRGVSL
jgi:hypothetical protein